MALLTTNRNIVLVHDRAQINHTLARAFQDDPALSWILPDAAQRKIRLPRMFDFIVPLDLRDGFALGSSGGEAATLWRSPGKPHTGLLDMVMMLPAVFHTFGTAALRGLAVSEAMDAHHPKGITYFYLHYAGVLPEHQGKGWGGAAIRAGLDKADAAGIPALLETATERNVGLYTSLGFEILSEWDVPKGGPHFWTMMRRVPTA
jgi:ribosomal protein S18 acetylase RimI-like enzyme